MISGLHWRNANPIAEDAFGIFSAGGFGSCVVMSNMGPELPMEIGQRFPGMLIIGRLYWPAGELPGHEEAVGQWMDYIQQTRHLITHYQILNETNEEFPNATPEQVAHWFEVMYFGLRASYPHQKFGFPMPSICGEPGWEYAQRCADSIQVADWLAERGYWEQDWQRGDWNWGRRYLRTREMWPAKPIHLAEYGCSRELDPAERARQYREYLASLPDWIGSANAYIMAGASGWERFWIDAAMAKAMNGEDDMPEYLLGFKNLAEQLGPDQVGDPQMNEASIPVNDGQVLTVQLTSKGCMMYATNGQAVFLPAVPPKA